MKLIILLLAYLACIFTASGQSFKYRDYKYEWKNKPAPISVEPQFKNEDAVILDEKVIFNAGGNRVPPFQYLNSRGNYFFIDESTNGLSPIVQKHFRIKFLTTAGVKKYATIALPESFDPQADWSTVRPEYRDSIFRPKGEFECIRYFAARVIREDGTISPAVTDEKTQVEIEKQQSAVSKVYSWIFRVINVEPGDELEVDYSYEGAYNHDPSSRIYFNGDLPKQNFDFTFRYPFEDYYVITYANGARPLDSVMETSSRPKYTEYHFSKKNLPGGIREPGARPYTQYPYITYYLHKRDFGIADPKTKFIVRPLPYPWSYVMLPLVNFQYENLKLQLSKFDAATRGVNDWLQDERVKSKDTSVAGIMSSIQHTLAAEFDYVDEPENAEDDGTPEHLAKYLSEKRLRKISRHRIYDEVFLRLDRNYHKVLFCDKRISIMDMNEYKYSTSFRTGYAAPAGNNFIYLYPKSYRFGYEANELPFYYEDIQTILIPQHEASEKKYDFVPEVPFIFTRTPFSGVKDNTRMTSALVNVSLDGKSFEMDARIRLSGQFSTMTRGYYLYHSRDTTVNPDYYNTLALISDDPAHCPFNVSAVSERFPYDASVSIKLSNHKAVARETDGTYSIDMEDWFNNIIDEDFTSTNRHLDYYPDFQFQDSHKYMLKFDSRVGVLNVDSLQIQISNGFADYHVSISQPDEQSVVIESGYIVKPEYAPASRAADVQRVFDAIRNTNGTPLRLKKL